MKKISSISLVLTLFGVLFFASCAKETPAPTSTAPIFTGYWNVSENSKDFGASTYNCTISDSTDGTHLLCAYLYAFNKKTYATKSGSNLIIPAQTIQGNSISGSGILVNANRLNLSYLVRTTATHYDTVTAVLTK